MEQAKHGDTVKVNYTGKFEDGTVFDSSAQRGPLEFSIGASEVIAGFERAVIGMSPGDSKGEKIPCEQAYGPHRSELLVKLDRGNVPPDLDVTVGQRLNLTHPDGHSASVTVADVSDDKLTLDANHPLAGKDLIFEIELVEIAQR